MRSPVALARRYHEQWVLETDPSEKFWNDLITCVGEGGTPQRHCAIHDVRSSYYEEALARRPNLKLQIHRMFNKAKSVRLHKAAVTIEWCVRNGVRLEGFDDGWGVDLESETKAVEDGDA